MELNKIDLNKLNTFVNVVEHGGISRAAQRLLLTRSAISQSVSSLEASLGISLFHRVGRKLVPTPAGQRLYRSARAYQRGLKRTVSEIIEGREEALGIVRLGLFPGFSKERMTRVISEFIENHPRARLKILFRSHRNLGQLLLSNGLDLALSLKPLSHEHSGVSSQKLYEDELHLVCGAKLYRRLLTPEEILHAPVIDYFESSPVFPDWVKHHLGKKVDTPNVRAYAGTVEYALELIQQNAGIGVVPRDAAEALIARGTLKRISTGRPEIRHFIWMNELKGSSPDRAVELFREALKNG